MLGENDKIWRFFRFEQKNVKSHICFWSPPPNDHFSKNVQKKLLASNTAQNSGPKIEFSKGLPFEFLPKMACFQKHSILTKTKKFLKIGRLPKRKMSVWNLYQILNFLFFRFSTPCVENLFQIWDGGLFQGWKRLVSVPG